MERFVFITIIFFSRKNPFLKKKNKIINLYRSEVYALNAAINNLTFYQWIDYRKKKNFDETQMRRINRILKGR